MRTHSAYVALVLIVGIGCADAVPEVDEPDPLGSQTALTGSFPVGTPLFTTDFANVRKDASREAVVLQVLPPGTRVLSASQNPKNGYYGVTTDRFTAWISGTLLITASDTPTTRLKNATAIRDVAAAAGITNSAVLGGIAQSETGFAHCWRDATWSCRGPNSTSCDGGPVVAGSADGDCSIEEGGLGMFQFDAGTYADTIAREGAAVLTLDGNIRKAVDFVADRVMEDISGIKTKAEALAWINKIPMVAGDARLEQWASLLACRYNGCCNSSTTCTTRRAGYRDNAIDVFNEFGAAFWAGPVRRNTIHK
jgi:hypothetical protein